VREGEQNRVMKLIPLLLLFGMLAASGWALDKKAEPYSAELVKKARAGDVDAQFNLGEHYFKGEGIAKDEAEAAKWFQKSADQKDALAEYTLGVCYLYGYGVPRNRAEALKLFNKSAEQGYDLAKEALQRLKSK